MSSRSRVENMEARLKKDIMNEIRVVQNCGNLVVSNELLTHQVVVLSSYDVDVRMRDPCGLLFSSHNARAVYDDRNKGVFGSVCSCSCRRVPFSVNCAFSCFKSLLGFSLRNGVDSLGKQQSQEHGLLRYDGAQQMRLLCGCCHSDPRW